jgi:hypothetical protein
MLIFLEKMRIEKKEGIVRLTLRPYTGAEECSQSARQEHSIGGCLFS